MKKILYSCMAIVVVIGLGLYAVSKLADSYAVAINALLVPGQYSASVGEIDRTLLISYRSKLEPNDTSCGAFLFLASGKNGFGLVEVLVRKRDFAGTWEVYDVLLGMGSESKKTCKGA